MSIMKNRYLVKLWDASSVYEMNAMEMEMTTEAVIDYIHSDFDCDSEYFLTYLEWSIYQINDIFLEVELEMDDDIRKETNELQKGAFYDDWDIIEHIEYDMQIVSKIVCKYDCENNELYKYI